MLQQLVKQRDQKGWKYRPGITTVRMTTLRLLWLIRRLFNQRTEQLNEQMWNALPGALLEHSARIANHTGCQLQINCLRNRSVSIIFSPREAPDRILLDEFPIGPRSEQDRLVMTLALIVDLEPFMRAVDAVGNGRPNLKQRTELCDGIHTMLRYACWFGPFGQRRGPIASSDREALAVFLSPLTRRLRIKGQRLMVQA